LDGGRLSLEPSRGTDERDAETELPLFSGGPQAAENQQILGTRTRPRGLQTGYSPKQLENRCLELQRQARTGIDETGTNLLHIALGFLNWYESDESEELNRAPLILIPIQIERGRVNRRTGCYAFTLSYSGEDIGINISLAEKLRRDFHLDLPTIGELLDVDKLVRQVRRRIRSYNRWEVKGDAVVGLFSFTKLLMYKDLDASRWPKGTGPLMHPLAKTILGAVGEVSGNNDGYGEVYSIDEDQRAAEIPLILDADSSQHSVLIDALIEQRNMVVQGPPGTGKSQTIANLIAGALNYSRTVLFVSEKKAALEVVRKRLDDAGLGSFVLELHSHKTQKGQLHQDLRRRLSLTQKPGRKQGTNVTNVLEIRDRLKENSAILDTRVGPIGEPVHDVIWKAEKLRRELSEIPEVLRIEGISALSEQDLRYRANLLEDIERVWSALPRNAREAWRGYCPVNLRPGDEAEVHGALVSLNAALKIHLENIAHFRANFGLILSNEIGAVRKLSAVDPDLFTSKPEGFADDFGAKFLNQNNVLALESLHRRLDHLRQLSSRAEAVDLDPKSTSRIQVNAIRSAAQNLVQCGFPEFTVKQLSEGIAAATNHLTALQKIREELRPVLGQDLRTVLDLLKVRQISEAIANTSISDLELHCCPAQALESTKILYTDASANARDLKLKRQMSRPEQNYITRRSKNASL
jgi:hypothetical protein